MPHVTRVFSTCNSKWLLERDRDHVKEAENMERPQKTE